MGYGNYPAGVDDFTIEQHYGDGDLHCSDCRFFRDFDGLCAEVGGRPYHGACLREAIEEGAAAFGFVQPWIEACEDVEVDL